MVKKNRKKVIFRIIFLLLIIVKVAFGNQDNYSLARAFSLEKNVDNPLIYSQQSPKLRDVKDSLSPIKTDLLISSAGSPLTPPLPKPNQAKINLAPKKNYQSNIILESRVVVTAYSSTVDQTDSTPFINAAGKRVRFGTVACNFLPLGTKIRFIRFYPDQIFIVEDRMNRRFSNRIDIWFPTRTQAKNFGKKKLKYQVIKIVAK